MTLSIQFIQIPETETVPQREYYLSDNVVTVGREYDCTVSLPDIQSQLSRRHAQISHDAEKRYFIIDLSKNGTKLNNTDLEPNKATSISDGDMVTIGDYKLLLGIVECPCEKAEDFTEAPPVFRLESDFSDDSTFMMKDAPDEQPAKPRERDFTVDDHPLDQDLMFDPFAEGPQMNTDTLESVIAEDTVDSDKTVRPSNFLSFDQRAIGDVIVPITRMNAVPSISEAYNSDNREQSIEALERAIERFLQDLDPAELEEEYNEFLGRWSNRQKHYWKIHKRQFAKKRQNGNFRALLTALFIEELRRR
tara:strand:+ start:20690 stop:21607 length:918 start_codon:yes stop_codon:yes gene_type:complete